MSVIIGLLSKPVVAGLLIKEMWTVDPETIVVKSSTGIRPETGGCSGSAGREKGTDTTWSEFETDTAGREAGIDTAGSEVRTGATGREVGTGTAGREVGIGAAESEEPTRPAESVVGIGVALREVGADNSSGPEGPARIDETAPPGWPMKDAMADTASESDDK